MVPLGQPQLERPGAGGRDPLRARGRRALARGLGRRAATGEGFEIGRVQVWEPGERLVVGYRNLHMPPGESRVEVRFEPIAGGTRVTLEHSGMGELPERVRESAWVNFIGWYRDYVAEKCS